MEEISIEEIKKGTSFKINAKVLEEEEFYSVTVECTNPAFRQLLKKFATQTTKEAKLEEFSFTRYRIKALLATNLQEVDTLLFEKNLVDTGKTVFKKIDPQGLATIKKSFDRCNKVMETMIGILFEEKKDTVYEYKIEVTKKA